TSRVFAAVAAGHASSVPSRPKLPPPEDPPARSRSRSASGLSNVLRGSPAAGKFVPSPAPPRLGPSEDSPAAQPPSTQVSPYSPWYLATPCPAQPAIPTPPYAVSPSPRPLLRVTPLASASLTAASHPRLPPFFASPAHQSLAAPPASCRCDPQFPCHRLPTSAASPSPLLFLQRPSCRRGLWQPPAPPLDPWNVQ
ncbi:proline-rich protein 36-like, partial [Eriocheir sinensis]|uniref:proline-rich protein 36-like n=1 Tax=Eriocheir sinensis TaxID=95602 RepID=UPI0021C81BAE